MSEDDGESWVEGINPGGFAARGQSPGEALAEFSSAFRVVLFDIASGAASFQDFHDEVQRLFDDTNASALRDWREAVERVRAEQIEVDWLSKKPAETTLGIEVTEVSRPQSSSLA